MEVSLPINWLSKKTFQNEGNPFIGLISNYTETKTSKGIDRMLFVKHLVNGKEYQFNVYGDNLSVLIKGLGTDSDKWKDKKIQVMGITTGEDKVEKKITVLQ